jgi:very-short-patch-repair endonuclease
MRDRDEKAQPIAKRLRASMTNAEVLLWSRLRRGQMQRLRFRRQHPIGPYVADFACASLKLIVEVDGATHATAEELAYDARRRQYFTTRGWREIRVANLDVYKHLDGVLDFICREADAELKLRERD